MEITVNHDNGYKTLRASMLHVLDADFLFGMAHNANAPYVYLAGTNGVILDFASIGQNWETIRSTLLEDGWDGDTMPQFIDLAEKVVSEGYQALHLSPDHALVKGAPWHHEDLYISFFPLGYNIPVQRSKDNKAGKFVLPDGREFNVSDLGEVSPPKLSSQFDAMIFEEGSIKLAVHINQDGNSVSVFGI